MSIVTLLPQKEFEIKVSDDLTVRGKFSLWSVKRYCDKRKLTLAQLEEQLSADKIEFEDICQMLLCAVEDVSRRDKKGFAYTDQDVCDWIEAMGGMMGEDYISLMNHARSELEQPKDDGEKKSQ